MPFEQPAYPLNRFTGFRTSDIEEFRHTAATRFGAKAIGISAAVPFEAHGSFVQLPDITLLFAASNASLGVEYPEFDFARMSIPLAGQGVMVVDNETVDINPHQSCIASSGRSTRVRCDENHHWLNLRVSSTALTRRLTAILGARPNGEVRFSPVLNLEHPRSKSLCQMVGFLAQQLDSSATELPAMVLQELEQAIVTSFLFATRHTFSDSLEQDSGEAPPWQVRRVEDYIAAHWNQAISIETLVEITGTSARAIFRAFRRSRGYSPMAFAKMVRLQHARAMLVASDRNTTVTGIALKCGFSNAGHFAREFREAFGHLPSETLARARLIAN
jgi:AraC-like DNA-binding protein